MYKFLIVLMYFTAEMAWGKSDMKLEGECKGFYQDGTKISLTYYSDFDGCDYKINAAIRFKLARIKGIRTISENDDTYSFNGISLVFLNSSGNTQGLFSYQDRAGNSQSVTLDCDVRDYEYSECSN